MNEKRFEFSLQGIRPDGDWLLGKFETDFPPQEGTFIVVPDEKGQPAAYRVVGVVMRASQPGGPPPGNDVWVARAGSQRDMESHLKVLAVKTWRGQSRVQ